MAILSSTKALLTTLVLCLLATELRGQTTTGIDQTTTEQLPTTATEEESEEIPDASTTDDNAGGPFGVYIYL